MWYKKLEDGTWSVGEKVNFSDGEKLHENIMAQKEGFRFFPEAPKEYLDWVNNELKKQNG